MGRMRSSELIGSFKGMVRLKLQGSPHSREWGCRIHLAYFGPWFIGEMGGSADEWSVGLPLRLWLQWLGLRMCAGTVAGGIH